MSRRFIVGLGLMAPLGVAIVAGPVWSQAVNASAASPTAQNEALMARVPETAGRWTRRSLSGARPGPDGRVEPAALAEFEADTWRASATVSHGGPPRGAAPTAPSEHTTADGTERLYAEGSTTVREFVRRIDQHAEVSYQRADGIVVVLKGYRMPPAELLTIARAIR